jgi:hypothetical protein
MLARHSRGVAGDRNKLHERCYIAKVDPRRHDALALQGWFPFLYARGTADLRGTKVGSPYVLGDARFQ